MRQLREVIQRARLELERRVATDAEYRAWLEESERELAAVEAAERAQRLRRAGAAVGPEMWNAIVGDTFDPSATQAGAAVAHWRHAEGRPLLVLQSGTGVGKTSAACWWLANRPSGGLVRIATPVASWWDSSTVNAEEQRERVCDVDGLVLDDVGTEQPRLIKPMAAALHMLLECRQGARTIITTNLSRKAWSERYRDERIDSRLARASWVVLRGKDLRREK